MKKVLLLVPLICSVIILSAQKDFKWKFSTSGRIYATPLIDGNRVYIGSGDSVFYAIDKTNGTNIWSFKTAGAIQSSASKSDNLIMFGCTEGNLYALEKETGKLSWKFSSEGEKVKDMWDYYQSSPVTANGIVYWGSGDGHMYALDAKTGQLVWKYLTEGIVHTDAAVRDDKVYFGSYDGNLYALSADKGELIWKFKTVGDTYFPKGDIQRGALIDSNIVYFGSRDYNIYALSAKTGRGKWNMKERGSWIIATPYSYKGYLYFGTSDTHRFYCLRKSDGEVIWSIPLNMRAYGSAVAKDDIVYFGCFNGKLYGVDYKTGKIRSEFKTDGCKANYSNVYDKNGKFREDFELYGKDYINSERIIHTLGSILSTPVIDGNVIYFGSSDGGLYAVDIAL